MAFLANDLSVLAYANGFTLWHYKSDDTNAVVTANDYFNNASEMLRVNDLIMANVDVDGTPATKIYIVTGNAGGDVTVADFSA